MFVLWCLCAFIGLSSTQANFSVSILFIGQYRGNWLPVDAFNSPCTTTAIANTPGNCHGGMFYLAYWLEAKRNALSLAGIPSVTIDAGNAIQGSIFSLTEPSLVTTFYNTLGIDAWGLGPRDFDYSTTSMNATIAAMSNAGTYTTVMSNVDLSNTTYWGAVTERYIYTDGVSGQRIGFMFLTAQNIVQRTFYFPAGNTVYDPVARCQYHVSYFMSVGINKIVVVGNEADPISGYIDLITMCSGVDVLLLDGKATILWQAGDNGTTAFPQEYPGPFPAVTVLTANAFQQYLGQLDITFNDAGQVVAFGGDNYRLTNASSPFSDSVKNFTLSQYAIVSASFSVNIGRADIYMNSSSSLIRVNETLIANFVADVLYNYSTEVYASLTGVQPDLVLINAGSLRSDINIGNYTLGNALALLPFSNYVEFVSIPGSSLLAVLQLAVSQINVVPPVAGGRFLCVSGVRYTYNPNSFSPNVTFPGSTEVTPLRLVTVEIYSRKNQRWESLELNATYNIVTLDYIINAGDGYVPFQYNSTVRLLTGGDITSNILINWIKDKLTANGLPITSAFHDRIVQVNLPPTDFYAPPPIQYITQPVGLIVAIYIIAGICMGYCLIILFLVIVYRNSQNIRNIAANFCYINLVGAFIVCSAAIVVAGPSLNCYAWVVLCCIGFILFFSSLIVKTLRIAELHGRIKKNDLSKIKAIKDLHLFPGILVMLLLEVILLVIWGAISLPVLQPTNSSTIPIQSYNICYFGQYATIFIAIQLTYLGLLLLIGCYYAVRVRNFKLRTHTETNELLFAIYTFAVFVVMVVIIQLTTNSQVAVVNPILVALICCFAPVISITILYVPRLYNIFFKNDYVDDRQFSATDTSMNSGMGSTATMNTTDSNA